jgi:hypothetical protein
MIQIHADELQVGDVIHYDGHPHLVARVGCEPGWAWPIASDACGWAIALGHWMVEVEREAEGRALVG